LYNHEVFGPLKGRGGDIGGITEEQLINNLITIHNAENWLGLEGEQVVTTEIKSELKTTLAVEVPIDTKAPEPVIPATNESINEVRP